jgi:hypothetical protein
MPEFEISLWLVICLLALTGCGITSDLSRKSNLQSTPAAFTSAFSLQPSAFENYGR